MANTRDYTQRRKVADAILDAMMRRTPCGSYRFSYVEGRDEDLCKDLPYNYGNLSVVLGEPYGRSNYVVTVDLLNRDETNKGIDQLVAYGLLPAGFRPNDYEEDAQ